MSACRLTGCQHNAMVCPALNSSSAAGSAHHALQSCTVAAQCSQAAHLLPGWVSAVQPQLQQRWAPSGADPAHLPARLAWQAPMPCSLRASQATSGSACCDVFWRQELRANMRSGDCSRDGSRQGAVPPAAGQQLACLSPGHPRPVLRPGQQPDRPPAPPSLPCCWGHCPGCCCCGRAPARQQAGGTRAAGWRLCAPLLGALLRASCSMHAVGGCRCTIGNTEQQHAERPAAAT